MEEQAFLDRIQEEPNDPAIRLMYADWLEERGDPRCEFIRAFEEIPRMNEHLKTLFRCIRDGINECESDWLAKACPQFLINAKPSPAEMQKRIVDAGKAEEFYYMAIEDATSYEINESGDWGAYSIDEEIAERDYNKVVDGFEDAVGLRIADQASRGSFNDGGEIYFDFSIEDIATGVKRHFVFDGFYSSWDSNQLHIENLDQCEYIPMLDPKFSFKRFSVKSLNSEKGSRITAYKNV